MTAFAKATMKMKQLESFHLNSPAVALFLQDRAKYTVLYSLDEVEDALLSLLGKEASVGKPGMATLFFFLP